MPCLPGNGLSHLERGGRWLQAEAKSSGGWHVVPMSHCWPEETQRGPGEPSAPAGYSTEQCKGSGLLDIAPATQGQLDNLRGSRQNENVALWPEARNPSPLPTGHHPNHGGGEPPKVQLLVLGSEKDTSQGWGQSLPCPTCWEAERGSCPRVVAGRVRLDGAQGARRQGGWEVMGVRSRVRGGSKPPSTHHCPWTSLTKHRFKDKT